MLQIKGIPKGDIPLAGGLEDRVLQGLKAEVRKNKKKIRKEKNEKTKNKTKNKTENKKRK